jgi:hypothetical protein
MVYISYQKRCYLLDGEAVGGEQYIRCKRCQLPQMQTDLIKLLPIAPNMKQTLRVHPRPRNLNCIEPLNSIPSYRILYMHISIDSGKRACYLSQGKSGLDQINHHALAHQFLMAHPYRVVHPLGSRTNPVSWIPLYQPRMDSASPSASSLPSATSALFAFLAA